MALKRFKYRISDKHNNRFENIIEAISKEEAKDILEKRGFKVIALSSYKNTLGDILKKLNKKKMDKKQELEFFADVYSLLKLGLSLNESLEQISKNKITNVLIKEAAHNLLQDLSKGMDFGSALINRGFKKDVGEIVKSGVAIGELKETIRLIVSRGELELKVSKGFKSLFILPMIMIPLLIIGEIVILLKLTPIHIENFKNVAHNFDQIPITSRAIFIVSQNIEFYSLVVFGTIGGIILGIYLALKSSKKLRNKLDERIIMIPIVGQFIYYKEMAKLTSMMNLGFGSGYRVEDIVKITKNQISNNYLKQQFEDIHRLVAKNGYKLSNAMVVVDFDSNVYTSIQRGEMSGNSDTVKYLGKLTEHYTERTTDKLKAMESIKGLVGTILILIFGMPIVGTVLMPQMDQLSMTMSQIRK